MRAQPGAHKHNPILKNNQNWKTTMGEKGGGWSKSSSCSTSKDPYVCKWTIVVYACVGNFFLLYNFARAMAYLVHCVAEGLLFNENFTIQMWIAHFLKTSIIVVPLRKQWQTTECILPSNLQTAIESWKWLQVLTLQSLILWDFQLLGHF